MKEKDARERVESFLRSTVRTVVVPASMGLGLTLVGCSGSSSESRVDAAVDAPIRLDTVADARRYDIYPWAVPEYGVPFRIDTNNDNAAYKPDTFLVYSNPDARLDTALDAARERGETSNPDARLDTAVDAAAERGANQPGDARDAPPQDAAIDGALSDGIDGR